MIMAFFIGAYDMILCVQIFLPRNRQYQVIKASIDVREIIKRIRSSLYSVMS